MVWIVYMLRCGDGSLYTGITNNLPRRLARHRAGTASAYTRSRRPVRLVYEERRPDRAAALRREAALRRLPRAAKLALVSGWVPRGRRAGGRGGAGGSGM